MPIPDLPDLPFEEDSLLSQKFGKELANYFTGNPLNRLSFLRTDHDFLQAAFSHPSTSFLLMHNLNPLVKDEAHLTFVSSRDVLPLTGPEPFGKKEADMISDFDSEETQPLVLFLGLDENKRLPPHFPSEAPFRYKEYEGDAYFVVDVTPRGSLTEPANRIVDSLKEKGLLFHEGSPRHMGLTATQGR